MCPGGHSEEGVSFDGTAGLREGRVDRENQGGLENLPALTFLDPLKLHKNTGQSCFL